jgi:hypothetical protein
MFVLVPKETIAVAGRADEKDGKDKDQAADCTRFAFNEEGEQIENHEDDMIVKEGRVDRLWNQQDGNQPLEAVHHSTAMVNLGLQFCELYVLSI